MQALVSETIQQVRDLAYRLRPVELDEFGLSRALEILVEDMTRGANLKNSCQCMNEEPKIPQEIQVVLYRIAQESLTNILRHAKASHLSLVLRQDAGRVVMIIEDDGVGFDPGNPSFKTGERHLGLISMRERAEMLGGTLDVYTGPGEGTSVQVSIPFPVS
jgi:signal transduction histidine kinase